MFRQKLRFTSKFTPLPDTPWPVAAKTLLTQREQGLYTALHSLYPAHRIFVQVALSQLVDVPEDHPDRVAVRNRFERLVADFVLCRADLSVVAVIELDDSSHFNPKSRHADQRKDKALADAGLTLVRIPPGALPSAHELRRLLDPLVHTQPPARIGAPVPRASQSNDCRPLADFGRVRADREQQQGVSWHEPDKRQRRASKESRAIGLRFLVLACTIGIIVVVYTQFIPAVINTAFQDMATKLSAPHPRPPVGPATTPAIAPTVPILSTVPSAPNAPTAPTGGTSASQSSASQMAAASLRARDKDQAWKSYYHPPAACEHPVDWDAQVECGNKYIRAKRLFESQWESAHGIEAKPVNGISLR